MARGGIECYRAMRSDPLSHSLEWRAIQSHASQSELNRPISSIVPSAHSACTYQATLSAVRISRGLKMGLPESGKPVFTLGALLSSVKFCEKTQSVVEALALLATYETRTPRPEKSQGIQERSWFEGFGKEG